MCESVQGREEAIVRRRHARRRFRRFDSSPAGASRRAAPRRRPSASGPRTRRGRGGRSRRAPEEARKREAAAAPSAESASDPDGEQHARRDAPHALRVRVAVHVVADAPRRGACTSASSRARRGRGAPESSAGPRPTASRCVANVCRSACGEMSRRKARGAQTALENPRHGARRQAPAARDSRREARRRFPPALSRAGAAGRRGAAVRRPVTGSYAPQRVLRLSPKGTIRSLRPLPDDAQHPRGEVHVFEVERPPLPRRAAPSRRAARRARARAPAEGPRLPSSSSDSVSVKRQRPRQRAGHARRGQPLRGIAFQVSLAARPAEEGPQRREVPRERAVRRAPRGGAKPGATARRACRFWRAASSPPAPRRTRAPRSR